METGKVMMKMRIIFSAVLLIVISAVCSCGNMFMGIAGPGQGSGGSKSGQATIQIRVAGWAEGGARTAIPSGLEDLAAGIKRYEVTVLREGSGTVCGTGTTSQVLGGSASITINLTSLPSTGTMTIWVKGYNAVQSGAVIAEGKSNGLSVAALLGGAVSVSAGYPATGAGSVNLEIRFRNAVSGEGGYEIGKAETCFFTSYEELVSGWPMGTETYLPGNGISGLGGDYSKISSIKTGIPSGACWLTINFYRSDGKLLLSDTQAVNVVSGKTTDKWIGSGGALKDYLQYEAEDFYSSNSTLAGISVGGISIPLQTGRTEYSIADTGNSSSSAQVDISLAVPGQSFYVTCNDFPQTSFSRISPLLYRKEVPSITSTATFRFTVGAPDRGSSKTYTVHYTPMASGTGYAQSIFYVDGDSGSAAGDGTKDRPYISVQKAVDTIRTNFNANSGSNWPKHYSVKVPGVIIVSGTIRATAPGQQLGSNGMVDIIGSPGLPTIIIQSSLEKPGTLDATGSNKRVMYIDNAKVILRDNITLTGGKDNASDPRGGGIYLTGTDSVLSIYDGTSISNNLLSHTIGNSCGGGIYIQSGVCTMYGGKISANEISGASGTYGGGVYISSSGTFNLYNGIIEGNWVFSPSYGGAGGVCNAGQFAMLGGIIKNNVVNSTPRTYSDGIYARAPITIGGSAVVSGDNGIYLLDNTCRITITSSLNPGGNMDPGGPYTLTARLRISSFSNGDILLQGNGSHSLSTEDTRKFILTNTSFHIGENGILQ